MLYDFIKLPENAKNSHFLMIHYNNVIKKSFFKNHKKKAINSGLIEKVKKVIQFDGD